MRQQGFDVAQDLTRLLQLTGRKAGFAHEEVQRALGIHQTQADFPADIFLLRQRRERLVVIIALTTFHDHPAELFQVAIDVFNFIRQLLDFGFEQVQQQLVSVAVHHRLAAGAHAIQAESGQLPFAQGEQTPFADSKRYGRVTGVILCIFKKEK